jgi:hypothetical protein
MVWTMMLADAINFPLLMLFGLVTIVPLTLAVVGIELLVLWQMFHISPKRSFKPLLIANILSTIAGWIVYMFQDGLLYLVGIRSLFDFAQYYLFGALFLIVLYFGKSVLVEGLYISRRKFVERLGAQRAKLWKAVVIANMASYLLVGPTFYFNTRPTFHGLEFAASPDKVTTCGDAVYFISS